MSGSIIITGASQGIGAATARAFLGAGWTVGLMARNAAKLEEIAAAQDHAIALPADVTDLSAVEDAFASFIAETGRLDVLFNNAGRGSPAVPIDEIPPEDWAAVVAVNLTGMFNCARTAFGQMRRQSPRGGRIINNGSISAYMPRYRSVPYTTTKHGVTGLTRALSLEGRDFDIACGQIDIGNAETEMTESMKTGKLQADGSLKPEPVMDVAHVASTVLHMASLPAEANVQFVTVMATKMPFIGRG